jgi:iron(III) transport system ATP-binding protein
MPELQLKNIHANYQQQSVLNGIDLSMSEGEIGCLLGPSGCGKTTLLRSIAGLHNLSDGEIMLANQRLSDKRQAIATECRKIGMVFQDYALFPHMTIFENIVFGIEKNTAENKQKRVNELLELVGLSGTENRYPHQLSGGQQQRIALARALAPKPKLLLLDEPFSGLDVELRESLAREVRTILKHQGIGALMVTHNQSEAFAIADSVGVMNKGELLQWDTPKNLYNYPKHPFVADFIGQGSLITGTVTESAEVETVLGNINCKLPENSKKGEKVCLLIRPHNLIHDQTSSIQLPLINQSYQGSHSILTLRLEHNEQVFAISQTQEALTPKNMIGVKIELDNTIAFHKN